ncbi:HNH endonuclease [Nevskia ramosa]|uniref:HNH endonuclease n=1 Tax=Nevskia ramosa TaxID=64002 RepID=UPI003D0B46A6
MIFLEMSRIESHGGGTWAFPNCIWSPIEKEGGGRWPFWEKVLSVKEGDTVLHLRGVQPLAYFVGYSRASGDGFTTTKRPPEAGSWSFSPSFYRADLADYTAFHRPISLSAVFSERRVELESYFDKNRTLKDKKHLFYVRQSGRLQCLNGAYLSEVDDELLSALFGEFSFGTGIKEERALVSVETGYQMRSIRARLGQANFSRRVKSLYNNKCCFPSCGVDDSRFLVGAHIARWSDNEKLRGHLGNGLCLCVFHDKAFELGLFTLDEHYNVYINPKELESDSAVVARLSPFAGHPINSASFAPLDDALLEHWIRIDVSP